MGELCFENDYTYAWVLRKFPCFLLDGVIQIFVVHGLLPVWSPGMDDSDDMFGALDFW